ncbi:DUF4239 domain-containing protein [Thiorhodococcus mannitoliphagus]|uniref:DUF4239 domain-containing protein n=1 Tax=Thiorhodococcus mannitoliphagus TaxID=329406 RepID=A0A6P1E2R9_9GAMM|nr:DUF4239 domain-containing protein [Thiorhodococcus mannitoliphagus]NEX21985.1 DUF4239 domain-containing protein [Thiorhodococcus mannitoliphagus]
MSQVAQSALLAFGLLLLLIGAQYVGRVIGEQHLRRVGRDGKLSSGAVEGAVFALLGLLLAFTFTGAASRFEHRRDLVVEHVNAMGTAWMRLDILPVDDQPQIRDLMRGYVDGVIRLVEEARDEGTALEIAAELQGLQNELWALAISAANRDGRPHVASLLLPPLNETFDLTTARLASARMHVHPGVVWFLIVLAMLAALLAGYGQAGVKHPNRLHTIVFAALISATLYFILDFEFPRLGFITLDSTDVFMRELRESLEPGKSG